MVTTENTGTLFFSFAASGPGGPVMTANPSLAAAVGQSYPLSGSPMPPQGPQATQGSPAPPPPASQPPAAQPVTGTAEGDLSGEIYLCFYHFDLLSEVIIFCLNLDQLYVHIYIWFNMFDFFPFSTSLIQ